MNQLLDYASTYAMLGWHIIPIVPHQKIPLTSHGIKDATTDTDQIRAWWEKWPDANIAVACGKASGVYVVDVDVTEAGDVNGHESLKEFPTLPETIRQNTPRGGFHAFYRTDDPPANRNSFRPGIDIRGDGYYVLLPPSIHPNGGMYVWAQGCAPWELEAVEFPDFMRPTKKAPWINDPPSGQQSANVRHIVPLRHADADVLQRASLYLAECDPAIQGEGGHDKLLWSATALVHGFLLSDEQALDLLVREYNPRCIPPWDLSIPKDEKDFKRKVSEARKLTPKKPRGWLLEADSHAPIDPSQMITKEDITQLIETSCKKAQENAFLSLANPMLDALDDTKEKSPYTIEYWLTEKPNTSLLTNKELKFLTHPTGLLGEICEWINVTALRKQPLLTLACALTFCGVLFGRKLRDSLGSRTNLYCMGIASSSAGKGHAPNQIRRLCEAAGCMDLLGGVDVGSDSGIEERMEKSPATLFLWDEIGHLLSHVRSGVSQYHVRVVPLLMKLYSAAGSIYKGREYADSDRQRTIVRPCCCIYGTSTPERFCEGITPEELQDGWLSRCLVFRTYTSPPKDRQDCDLPIPQHISEQVRAWYTREMRVVDTRDISAFVNPYMTSVQPPEEIVVPQTDEAEQLFISLDDESVAFGKSNPPLACLWTKSEENARRIALILAGSEDFDMPRITKSIADYACRLVRYLLLDFGRETAPNIVTCHIDAKKQKLLKVIKKHGVDGCPRWQLTRSSQWTNKREREVLLEDLIDAGEIIRQAKEKDSHLFLWTVENYRKFLKQQNDS